jgi:hypothetical protein
MPKIKLATDESIIYFEDVPFSKYAHEVEVEEEKLERWRNAMIEADVVQDEMRRAYADAVVPDEIPPEGQKVVQNAWLPGEMPR